jgi:hypothetical protein
MNPSSIRGGASGSRRWISSAAEVTATRQFRNDTNASSRSLANPIERGLYAPFDVEADVAL